MFTPVAMHLDDQTLHEGSTLTFWIVYQEHRLSRFVILVTSFECIAVVRRTVSIAGGEAGYVAVVFAPIFAGSRYGDSEFSRTIEYL